MPARAFATLMFLFLMCPPLLTAQVKDSLPLSGSRTVAGVEMRMQAYTDSLNRAGLQRSMENSYHFFREYQQQQRKKQRRQMILYFAMGAAMLAVLVFGLRRRRKQP